MPAPVTASRMFAASAPEAISRGGRPVRRRMMATSSAEPDRPAERRAVRYRRVGFPREGQNALGRPREASQRRCVVERLDLPQLHAAM